MIMLEYLKVAKGRQRIITQGWVTMNEMPVVLTLAIDQATGGQFFKIEDEVSGAYFAYHLYPKDAGDFNATKDLIDTMLKTEARSRRFSPVSLLPDLRPRAYTCRRKAPAARQPPLKRRLPSCT
ncbi:MAG: hypothetical protein V2I67_03050 [Thermoanaerobaculales bacterium]|jgi:hypothetical protein|nr:hypothetical protein [Thermoanaerobaculales bacterium]